MFQKDHMTFVETEMPLVCPSLICSRCKQPVDKARSQLVGKSYAVVRCNTCNTRATQLSRCPGWKSFQLRLRNMPGEERALFWQGCAAYTSKECLADYIDQHTELVNKHSERADSVSSGEWLPLGVYAVRGFDTKRIEALCKDTREDPILGRLYRVAIGGMTEISSDEKIKKEVLTKGQASGASSGSGHQPTPEKPTNHPPAEKPPNPANLLKSQQTMASRIMSKLCLVTPALQINLKHKVAVDLPVSIRESAQALLDEMLSLEQMCKKTLKGAPSLEDKNMSDAGVLVPSVHT